jgi:hypothetical protein
MAYRPAAFAVADRWRDLSTSGSDGPQDHACPGNGTQDSMACNPRGILKALAVHFRSAPPAPAPLLLDIGNPSTRSLTFYLFANARLKKLVLD